jgi:hypothetical protein
LLEKGNLVSKLVFTSVRRITINSTNFKIGTVGRAIIFVVDTLALSAVVHFTSHGYMRHGADASL